MELVHNSTSCFVCIDKCPSNAKATLIFAVTTVQYFVSAFFESIENNRPAKPEAVNNDRSSSSDTNDWKLFTTDGT